MNTLCKGAALGVSTLLGIQASAQTPPIEFFELATQNCEHLRSIALRSLLSVEIGAPMNGLREVSAGAEPSRVIRIFLECIDENNVEIRLREQVTSASVDGELAFDSEVSRERRLALAVAELVEESRGAWENVSPRPPEKVVEIVSPMENEPNTPPFALRLSTGTELAFAPVRQRFNLRGDAHVVLTPRLELSAGLGFSYDETSIENGQLRTTAASAAVVVWRHTKLGSALLSGGAGARYGWAWLRGRPDNPEVAQGSTLSDPFGGPMITALAEWTVGRARLGAGLEAGLMTARVQGLSFGEEIGGLDEGWVSLAFSYRQLF